MKMNERVFFLRLLGASIAAMISISTHIFLSYRYENVIWLAPFYWLFIGFGADFGNLLSGKKMSWVFERASDTIIFVVVSVAIPTSFASFLLMIETSSWMLIFALSTFFLCDFCSYRLGSLELKERTIYFRAKKIFS
jgi:hypothetical protein